MCHKHNTALFVRTGQSLSSALQHLGAIMIKTDVSKKKKKKSAVHLAGSGLHCGLGWSGTAGGRWEGVIK